MSRREGVGTPLQGHHRGLRIVEDRPGDARTHLVVDCWKLMGFSRIDGTSVLLLLCWCGLFSSPSWWESACVTLLPIHHPPAPPSFDSAEAICMWAGRVQSKQFPILCVKLSSSQLKPEPCHPTSSTPSSIPYRSDGAPYCCSVCPVSTVAACSRRLRGCNTGADTSFDRDRWLCRIGSVTALPGCEREGAASRRWRDIVAIFHCKIRW